MTPPPSSNSSTFGLSPGTLVYVGPEVAKDTTIKLVEYNEEYHEQRTIKNLKDCQISGEKPYISWLVGWLHQVLSWFNRVLR